MVPPGVGGSSSATTTTTGEGGGVSVTSTTTSGSGGGMVTEDGNDSFEEATDFNIDEPVQDTIDFNTDSDYFRFAGSAGQVLFLITEAKPDAEPFAPGYVDLVVELYDSNQQLIATSDDDIPRTTQDSQMITRLPADGEYFLRITDFCNYATCEEPQVIDVPDYAFQLIPIDFSEVGNVDEAEGTPIDYAPSTNPMSVSGFFAPLITGTFDDGSDIDTFEFKLPDTYGINNEDGLGRPSFNFQLYPSGTLGNGSTAPVGDVWVTAKDPVNGCSSTDTTLARVDGTLLDPLDARILSMPARNPAGEDLTGDTTFANADTFCLHVATSASTVGPNPFYILTHYGSASNNIEIKEVIDGTGSNDDVASAEAPVLITGGANDAYFVGGDLPSATDVDVYALDLTTIDPAAVDLFVACSSRNIGSGLTSFTARILGADGTTELASETEAEPDNLFTDGGIDIPDTAGVIYLELSATGIDGDNTGSFYRCGANFVAPTN